MVRRDKIARIASDPMRSPVKSSGITAKRFSENLRARSTRSSVPLVMGQ